MTTTIVETPTLEDLPDWFANISDALEAHATASTTLLVTAWQTGAITTAELQTALEAQLEANTASAWSLSDALAAALLATAPLGIVPPTAWAIRHHKAVATLTGSLDEGVEGLLPRAVRLTSSVATEALAAGLLDGYEKHGINGYVRGTDADPCELCVWLKKENLRPGGFVYPVDQRFFRHPGCQCTPIPVLDAPVYKNKKRNRRRGKATPMPNTDQDKLTELRARLRAAKVHKDEIDIRNLERLIAKLENK